MAGYNVAHYTRKNFYKSYFLDGLSILCKPCRLNVKRYMNKDTDELVYSQSVQEPQFSPKALAVVFFFFLFADPSMVGLLQVFCAAVYASYCAFGVHTT